jgi:hypothetical protein
MLVALRHIQRRQLSQGRLDGPRQLRPSVLLALFTLRDGWRRRLLGRNGTQAGNGSSEFGGQLVHGCRNEGK